MEHFFSRIQVKTKKKVFTRNGTLFLSTDLIDLRSDAHQSQIIGGDADEDHTQIVGGVYSQIIGGIYPPIPPLFRHHCNSLPQMVSFRYCSRLGLQQIIFTLVSDQM